MSLTKFKLNSLSLSFELPKGLSLLDQTQLPNREVWIDITSTDQMVEAIQSLRVRGAPLIGIAASLFLAHQAFLNLPPSELHTIYQKLRAARPTAVNLMNNLDYCWSQYKNADSSNDLLIKAAVFLFEQDVTLCNQMAMVAQPLIQDSDQILTYCNTGGLATAGGGTALGAIKKAFESKPNIYVYPCETRPLGQGARLTLWELEHAGIPNSLICDNMAATLMQQKMVSKVFVGADRITQNYDFANKIGTYNLAVLAKYHQIPFYVVAPSTTFDLNMASGDQIQIELRPHSEILNFWGIQKNLKTFNPGFDVTPSHLVTAIITEDRILYPNPV